MVKITEVAKNSRAAKKGVLAGDVLVSINEREISDVLDYRFFLTNTEITLSLLRDGEPLEVVKQEAIPSLSTGVFFDVKADNGAPLVVGEMVNRNADGSVALMVCAADDPHETDPKEYQITFRAPDRCVRALGGDGYKTVTDLGDGVYAVAIKSNEGVLITAR